MSANARLHPWIRFVFAALMGLSVAVAALAAGKPFDRAAFEAAQKAGRPILLTVHADWCVTCRAQDPIVEALLKQPKYRDYVVFRVDFDRQKDLLREFRVQWQSTLIVFRGSAERARSTAAVSEEAIAAQLAKAL